MTKDTSAPNTQTGLLPDVAETLDQGVAIYDGAERLIFCNQAYSDQFPDLSGMLKPGMPWREFVRSCIEHGYAVGQRSCDQLRQEGITRTTRRAAGGRDFDLSYRPMPNGGFVITREDITEKVRAEADAAHHAALLTRILETNPIPVVMARFSDSKIMWRSPAALDLIGYSEFAIDHFHDPGTREDYVALLKADGRVEDFRTLCRAADGSVISVALSGMLTEFEGETCVVSSITDLTEVLEREALLRQVIEACPAPVLMNRADTGEILYRSPELIALFGEGMDASKFYVDPSERDGFLAALRKDGEVTEYRARLLNAAGTPFWAAISGRLTEWNGEEVLVTFTRDLSQQLGMEAELDRQREHNFQVEKMSALGSLLAGVAHELNNPLSVVVGHAMMLREEANDENTLRQTQKISEAAERCARIVKTFLSMARQEPSRMETLDVNEIAQVAIEVARYGDDARAVRIESRLDEGLSAVAGDSDQLTQVAVNLILNAEQAIAASGVGDLILLSTSATEDGVSITFEDNGPGVPADIRKRVFEPFFTTKGVGQGTGIGLSMCHQIVSAHQGSIRIEDVNEGGARFVVTLPVAGGAEVEKAGAATAPTDSPAAIRVLVIDDEEEVAELNAEVLNRGGYEATAVFGVEEALKRLDAQPFDVIISDLNMPDLDGRALFEMVSRNRPELTGGIGFITGDTLGRSSQMFLAEADRPYLEKPVSPRELRDFVAQLSKDVRA